MNINVRPISSTLNEGTTDLEYFERGTADLEYFEQDTTEMELNEKSTTELDVPPLLKVDIILRYVPTINQDYFLF